MIERGHRRDDARQHSHRVRINVEAVKESQQRFINHRMALNRLIELRELIGARQFAVNQQVGHFQEVTLLCQLLDRIAAMQQHACVTIDIGDFAFASCSAHEARIEREDAVILGNRSDTQHIRTERAALKVNGGLSAGR